MNILKTLSFILLTTILTACDNGTISKNKECGMVQGEERIEGYNTEICDKDKDIKRLITLFGSVIEDSIPEKHSASSIKDNIEADESEKSIKEENNQLFSIAAEGVNIIILIIGTVGLISGALMVLFSKSVNEKNDYNDKDRYKIPFVIGIAVLGILLSLNYAGNHTVGQRLAALPFHIWPKLSFNKLNSAYQSSTQTGDILTDNTSENVILDSTAAFKAHSITMAMNKGVLSDLRTAKYTFEKNLERKVEHNEPLKITIIDDAIYIDRYKDNKILNKIIKIEFHKSPLKNSLNSKAFTNALDANITSNINEIEPKAESFKRAFITSSGYELTDPRINMATQEFITESFKLALYIKLEEIITKHYELMRLVEETKCYDGKKQSDNKSITHTAKLYIKYLKGESSEPNLTNACIKEPIKGEFFVMGNKSKEVLAEEELKLNLEIFNTYYRFYRQYEVALSKSTIDKVNALYCKKARQEGYSAAIVYDNKCRESNYENRKLMNALTASHTIKDYARNSFIQTEFTKNDQSNSPLLNVNFDNDIQRLSLQIGIKPTKALLSNKSETIDYLVNSNSDFNSNDAKQIFLEPINTFKKKIGITKKDCQLNFTACLDPEKFMTAINHYSDDLIEIGQYPLVAGIVGSAAIGRQEKADNKSNTSDLEYGKKGTTKKQKNKTASKLDMVNTAFASVRGIGGLTVLAGAYSKVVVNFITLFYAIAIETFENFKIVAYVLYPLVFLWMLFANDLNNIKSNSVKIVGQVVFFTIMPTFILASYLVAKTIIVYMLTAFIITFFSDTAGWTELIARGLIVIPLIHFLILTVIRNIFIDPMRILSEQLLGDSTVVNVINDILAKAMAILSFGANLSFIYSMTKRRS